MKDQHVIDILESAPLAQLGERELSTVRAHVEACAGCRRAYEATQISSLLIRERAAATAFEPSPFFQTRVLAALRERQAALPEVFSLGRLWRAAGGLVSSLATAVVLLGGLTLFGLMPTTDPTQQSAASADPYSAEAVLFEQAELGEEEINYGQVYSTIYESDDDAEGVNGQDR
ncbi:MAG TPA: hypothetical protein VF240_17775 [Pyrinomonadaceae bacterium]